MLERVARATRVVGLRGYGTSETAMGVPYFYIIMPRCDSSLAGWRERLPRAAAGQLRCYLRIFREVVESVREVHGFGVVHFDVKPHNLLLASREGAPPVGGRLVTEVGWGQD